MKLEKPIKVPKRCKSCRNATALLLLAELDQLKLFDEDGQQVHFKVLDDSIIIWRGDDVPEEVNRPIQDYPM